MKLREVKDFLNTLTDEQLEQSFAVTGEGFKAFITSIEVLDVDLYYDVNSPEDGCFHIEDVGDIDKEDLVVGIRKGTVLFDID